MEPYTPYRPYKPRTRGFSVSVETGPDEVELPGRVGWYSGPSPPGPPSRGPVRLRVVMPAPPFGGWGLALLLALAVFTPIVIALTLTQPNCACGVIFYLVIGIAILAMWLHPLAREEILVIDSRLVTLHRDKALKGVWGRHQFEDVRVAHGDDRGPIPRAGHRPTLAWGGRNASAGAGAGITLADAESLVETIRAFMDEHPPDKTLDYRGSGTPFG